jgi:hypothetical protein
VFEQVNNKKKYSKSLEQVFSDREHSCAICVGYYLLKHQLFSS